MKVHTYRTYSFKELNEEAKQKALETMYDINTDYDWYESLEEDAKNIGLEISSFDLYSREIEGKLLIDAIDVCKKIMKEHGKKTDTYATAKRYKTMLEIVAKEDNQEDKYEDIQNEFLRDILEDYRELLQKEYDYLSSEEAIIETIEANEYQFLKNGSRKMYV